MTPYGAICEHPPHYETLYRVAAKAANALAEPYGTRFVVGAICDIIYMASGSSVDYTYAKLNVTYSFAVELRDRGRYGFLLPPNQIVPSGKELVKAVTAMIQAVQKENS